MDIIELKKTLNEAKAELQAHLDQRDRAEESLARADFSVSEAEREEAAALTAFQSAVLGPDESASASTHERLMKARQRVALAKDSRIVLEQATAHLESLEAERQLDRLQGAVNRIHEQIPHAVAEAELARLPKDAVSILHRAFAAMGGRPWDWSNWAGRSLQSLAPSGPDAEGRLAKLRDEVFHHHGLA
jgi:hypothetical protein